MYVFCGPRESFWLSTEESVGMGIFGRMEYLKFLLDQ